jgi:MscS family membrane protein
MKYFFLVLLASVSCLVHTNEVFPQEFDETDTKTEESSETYQQMFTLEEFDPVLSVDLSSPRATFDAFTLNITLAHYYTMLVLEEDGQLTDLFRSKRQKVYEYYANVYLERAKNCLNLSHIKSISSESIRNEKAILLKEVLDKLKLDPASFPDETELKKQARNIEMPWRISNSQLYIEKIKEGPDAGSFKFSKSTVENIFKYYTLLYNYPYNDANTTPEDYILTPNFYEFYVRKPGQLVPPIWSKYIPDSLNRVIFHQTLWQWLSVFITFIIYTYLFYYFWASCKIKAPQKHSSYWIRVLKLILIFIILTFINNILDKLINLTGHVLVVIDFITHFAKAITFSTAIFFLGSAINNTILKKEVTEKKIPQRDAVKAIVAVFTTIIAFYILIRSLDKLGFSLVPLITSLGIAGLAVALAVRPTLANFIASFMIYSDHPYYIGDWIKVSSLGEGKVESIGFRSTKIRLKSGEIVNIPNDKIVTNEVVNYSTAKYICKELEINIISVDTPEEIEKVIQLFQEALTLPKSKETTSVDTSHMFFCINEYKSPSVNFKEFTSSGFVIKITYWFTPADVPKSEEFHSHLNSFLFKTLHKEGVKIIK